MTREEFDNSLNTAYGYDDIKKDLNIVKNKPNKNITVFHIKTSNLPEIIY